MSRGRNKRKQKSRGQAKYSDHQRRRAGIGIKYQQISPLFGGMSDEEIADHLRSLGEESDSQYQLSLQELEDTLSAFDPLLLLSLFSYYGLTTSGANDPELTQVEPILQHHVELVQALLLKQHQNGFGFRPAMPPDFEHVRSLVHTISRAFIFRRFAGLDLNLSQQHSKRLFVRDSMRVDTQAIRNWGYPQQIMAVTAGLFSPLDHEIERRTGVRVTYLLTMLNKVTGLIEERINSHLYLLVPMVRAKTLEVMVQEYCQAFPDLQSEPDELYRTLRKHHFGVDQAKLMLISHSDLRLSDIFTLTLDDFVNAYPVTIEAESVRAILTLWSLTFGDLAEQTSEHFFMNNPIWERPLIDLGEDRFFWPIPSIFLSFCTELMVQVIEPFPDLIARHETWRGKYLENEVERLFGSAMPAAKIYRGNQWQDVTTGKLFENDLAVLVDTHLIIVEAKSGRMPASARRGAESSLENGIDELVVKASRQANRFAEYLQKNPGIHRFSTRAGRINEIDTSEVREVIRLNITLEPIGMLQTRLPEFQAAGYIPLDVDPVPSLLLTDLQTVFYILETTCEKLHYLRRRAQLEKKADYFADELDLLALYLDTGFNLGDTEANATLMLSTLSKTLDPHLMREWTQEDTPKPQHNLTQWWKDIIEYIEERKPPRWTEIGYMLLNVAYKDQVGFERRFAQVQKTVRKHWQMPGHKNNTILLYGPEWRREALVGVAYKEIDSRERNRLMSNTGGYAMEEAPASQALIIGIDVDRPHYPYNVVACTHKNEGDLVA